MWALGRGGEMAVKKWLMGFGLSVVPTGMIENGGAPVLEGWARNCVLPDLQVFGDTLRGWVEVKTKSRATRYRKTGEWEHGLKLSNWDDYLRVEARTGLSAFLAILELETNIVLLASMSLLNGRGRVYRGDNMPDGKPHIFFPRGAFEWYHGPSNLDVAPLLPKATRTLSQRPAPAAEQIRLL